MTNAEVNQTNMRYTAKFNISCVDIDEYTNALRDLSRLYPAELHADADVVWCTIRCTFFDDGTDKTKYIRLFKKYAEYGSLEIYDKEKDITKTYYSHYKSFHSEYSYTYIYGRDSDTGAPSDEEKDEFISKLPDEIIERIFTNQNYLKKWRNIKSGG